MASARAAGDAVARHGALGEPGGRDLHVVAARVIDLLELSLHTHTQDQLTRSNELLLLFAGQVSHDLRTPLTAVLANTELLATEPAVADDPALLRLVTATMTAGRRMSAMIETILAYARVGATLERTDVRADQVLDHVLDDLGPVLGARSATVRREPLPRVLADPDQLYAVLLNLVSNAVKFTPPERVPEIAVGAARVEEFWRFTVTDTGRGIPAEARESVFELYRRGDRSVEGSGIGLAIARRAVEAHGGRIGIEAGAGGGTTVWFTLPA